MVSVHRPGRKPPPCRLVGPRFGAVSHLFEILYPHGDVEPIENVVTAVTKAELGKPYGIPAVRQEGDRLTGLHTFS